jgi:hypothetical protein
MDKKFGCLIFLLLLLAGLGVGGYFYLDKLLELFRPKVTIDIQRELFENTEFIRSLENLELAERRTRETIEETDSVRVTIPYFEQEIVSSASYEVRFNVTYTYVVSARREDWQFKLINDILYVHAPQIEARPPAIDTRSIEARIDGGFLVLDEENRVEEIKKSLSAVAAEKAVDSLHIDLVREQCRSSLENHIYNWFFKDRYEVKTIHVRFADEEPFPVFLPEGEAEKKYEFEY